MSGKLLSAAVGIAVLALSTAVAQAQVFPEIVVRQGDKIEWSATAGPPHIVRFGGNGATSVAEVNTILTDFQPPLTPGAVGNSPSSGGAAKVLLTAKVRDDAPAGKTFVFVCGVHLGAMLSYPVRVEAKVAGQAERTHKIIGVPGPDWHLHIDQPQN